MSVDFSEKLCTETKALSKAIGINALIFWTFGCVSQRSGTECPEYFNRKAIRLVPIVAIQKMVIALAQLRLQ